MKDHVYIDFETQSTVGINDPSYLTHNTTRVLVCGYSIDNGPVKLWVNPLAKPPQEVVEIFNLDTRPAGKLAAELKALEQRKTFVAHNGEMFDGALARRFFALENTARWVDTMHLCKLNGLPASLKHACKRLGLDAKQDNDAVMTFTKAKIRHDAVVYPSPPLAVWKQLLNYAKQDVKILRQLHETLLDVFDLEEAERLIIQSSQLVNARGYKVDREFARTLLDRWADIGINARERMRTITKGKLTGDDIRSPAKIKAWIEETHSVLLPSVDKRAIDEILDSASAMSKRYPKPVVELLQLRRDANRNSAGKTAAFFDWVDREGFVKHGFKYFGAQKTGRYSGHGVQPHNFTRGNGDINVSRFKTADQLTLKELDNEAKRLKISTADILATLARNCIVPSNPKCVFGIVDYAAIEARCVAWMANASELVDAFNEGADVYCLFASEHLFKRLITKKDKPERQAAKQVVLGCGYQMGAPKFALTCEAFKIDLASVGLNAAMCVKAYRDAYPQIKTLWHDMQSAAMNAVKHPGSEFTAGRCVFVSNGEHLANVLPSGRCLRYWFPEIRLEFPTAFDSKHALPVIYYRNPYGQEETLYGGKLLENASQGSCRDILASKMVVGHSEGFDIPLHVHDEIVCELKKSTDVHRMAQLMSETEGFWYEDFPLEVEGFTASRYTKAPYDDSLHVRYRNGRKV